MQTAASTGTNRGADNARSASIGEGVLARQPGSDTAIIKNNAAARDFRRGLSRAAASKDRTGEIVYFFPAAKGAGAVFWKL